MRTPIRCTLCFAAVLSAGSAQADEVAIQWHGFVSAGATLSNSATKYEDTIDDKGSYTPSRFGLTIAAQLDREWRAAGQLFTHNEQGSSAIELDWGFISYRPSDRFALDMGKIKYPNNLISEYFETGFAYPWVRPPAEFYSHENLGPNMTFEQFTGFSPIFSSSGTGTRYSLQPFVGETSHDDGSNKKLFGVKAGLSQEGLEALIGYSRQLMVLNETSSRFAENNDKTLQVLSVGFSLDRRNTVIYAEYAKSKVEDRPDFDTTAGYATYGYRFGKYLPNITYAWFDQESGLGQTSITLGLRRELTAFAAVKAELKSIDPKQRRTALASGARPAGLFETLPNEDRINIVGVSVELVF